MVRHMVRYDDPRVLRATAHPGPNRILHELAETAEGTEDTGGEDRVTCSVLALVHPFPGPGGRTTNPPPHGEEQH